VTRRQLLFRSSAAWVAGLGAINPLGIARAASLIAAPPSRQDAVIAPELGGVVLGTYQLRTLSTEHHTIS